MSQGQSEVHTPTTGLPQTTYLPGYKSKNTMLQGQSWVHPPTTDLPQNTYLPGYQSKNIMSRAITKCQEQKQNVTGAIRGNPRCTHPPQTYLAGYKRKNIMPRAKTKCHNILVLSDLMRTNEAPFRSLPRSMNRTHNQPGPPLKKDKP